MKSKEHEILLNQHEVIMADLDKMKCVEVKLEQGKAAEKLDAQHKKELKSKDEMIQKEKSRVKDLAKEVDAFKKEEHGQSQRLTSAYGAHKGRTVLKLS